MIWRRLLYLLRRRRIERELAEEMAAHREMMGAPQDFGNSTRLHEEAGDVWGWRWLDEIGQDLRHGMRVFRRTPTFTLTVVAVLTLGLGLNLGLVQILNAALLKTDDLRDPGTLVRLRQIGRHMSSSGVSYPVTQFIKEHNDVLSSVFVVHMVRAGWGNNTSEQIPAAFVSSNFFRELGAGAVQGRVLHEGETSPVVVLSHEFWRSRLGSDAAIVGSTVRFNGKSATVAGVASAGFYGPRADRVHMWIPIEQVEHFYPGSRLKTEWANPNVNMYARLKPGVSAAAAEAALRTPMAEARKLHPKEVDEDPWLSVSTGDRNFRGDKEDREVNTIVALITGLCLLVLAVACANLTSLMVAHISARMKEFQMRAALGAGRGRVVRQILTECVLLVAAGTIGGWYAGFVVANWILAQTDAPFGLSPVPDWRLTLAIFLFGLVALVGVGLLPAWRALSNRLVAGRTTRNFTQRILVGVQVLGSCVLLLIAGMTAKKLQSLASADLGFSMNHIAVMEVSLSQYGLQADAAAAYWRAVRDAVAGNGRVSGVALTTLAPMGNSLATTDYNDAPGLKVTTMTVDADFHGLLQIPILTGRKFEAADTRESAIIISRRLAETMYGTLDVLGRSFPKSGDGPRATIVGVAADARLIKVVATDTAESYSPMGPKDLSNAILLARVDSADATVLRRAAQSVSPAIAPAVRWMKDDFDKKLLAPRMTIAGAGFMGGLALILTCIGISGLVSYTVSLRTKEIGIRLALGAEKNSVLWLVLRGLIWPVSIGAVVGAFAATFGLARPLSGQPLFLDPGDPLTVTLSLAVLAASGMIAGSLPALRALAIDPSSALRQE